MISRYAFLQRECHRLLNEVFESKGEGYIWLEENFHIRHFASFNQSKDIDTLEEIYRKLHAKSILEY